MNLDKFIEKRFLEKVDIDINLINKELKESDYDLEEAKKELNKGGFKWCIVKCYYAMFHSAKAFLFSIGLREKKHFVIAEDLEELSKDGKLEIKYVNDFRAIMSDREDADYRYIYSKETAVYNLNATGEFIKKMRDLIKNEK